MKKVSFRDIIALLGGGAFIYIGLTGSYSISLFRMTLPSWLAVVLGVVIILVILFLDFNPNKSNGKPDQGKNDNQL